jgi:transcriptional regulator with XRE-family HTH domain
MGGPGSGARLDRERRRRVLQLRARGLTLERIAARLGVSRQTVCNHLRASGACKRAVRCALCRREVGPPLSQPGHTPAYCPACLARHPDAPFAVRLKSCRAAAGLTVGALAGRIRTNDGNLRHYEWGQVQPGVGLLCRLARVLGPAIYPPAPAVSLIPTPSGRPPAPGAVTPRCRDCGADLAAGRTGAGNNGPAYCLACLARHPEAPFGQRLKAYRLAAGLSLAGLAARCGLSYQRVGDYERGVEPNWRALVALVGVLGHGLFPPLAPSSRGPRMPSGRRKEESCRSR